MAFSAVITLAGNVAASAAPAVLPVVLAITRLDESSVHRAMVALRVNLDRLPPVRGPLWEGHRNSDVRAVDPVDPLGR